MLGVSVSIKIGVDVRRLHYAFHSKENVLLVQAIVKRR